MVARSEGIETIARYAQNSGDSLPELKRKALIAAPLALAEINNWDQGQGGVPESWAGTLKYGSSAWKRNALYTSMSLQLEPNRGRFWFAAAGMVTGRGGIKDLDGKLALAFIEAIDQRLILEGNAFLFPYNLHNFFLLRNRRELPGLTGLWGQSLDRALVVFEQTLVQRFIERFNWPGADAQPASLKRISKAFYGPFSNEWLKATLRGVLGEAFDFGSLDHRIQFGIAAVNRLRTGR
jgi:hypothetical protein